MSAIATRSGPRCSTSPIGRSRSWCWRSRWIPPVLSSGVILRF